MESTLAAQQKELAKVTSDLGKARSEMLTKVGVLGVSVSVNAYGLCMHLH